MEILDRDSIDYQVQGHSLREIINYNEYLVLKLMRRAYEANPGLCRCSLCVEDIFALSLNSLPPRYIQGTSLRTYEKSPHFIGEEEVGAKVREALDRVRKSPNH